MIMGVNSMTFFIKWEELKGGCNNIFLTLSAPGEWRHIGHPCRFFDRWILSARALKLILFDFFSNFILNMWQVQFFWSVE